MIPTILFLKAQVKGYTRRDGVFVKPHHRKGGAAAQPGDGQLSLFESSEPEPSKPAAKKVPKKATRTRLDPVETAKKVLEWHGKRPKGSALTSRAGWVSGWAYANGAKVSDADEDAILAELDKIIKERVAGVGKPEPRVVLTKPEGGEKLKASELDFQKVKNLIGNSLDLKEWDVDNGGKVKAQVKTTTRGGEIKTARLHVTIVHPNGRWEYYKENAKGTFERVSSGRS